MQLAENTLQNCDWIKYNGWDFDFNDLVGFFASKYLTDAPRSSRVEAVRKFMSLPAFRAASDDFKNQANDFLRGFDFTPKYYRAVKYNPDQPRDERGRFGSGNGNASTTGNPYEGSHDAPSNDGFSQNMLNIEQMMPDVMDPAKGLRYYGMGGDEEGRKADRESIAAIQSVTGDPNQEFTIYRAVPKGADSINNGDWVTLSPTYAQMHIDHALDGEGVILTDTAKASELYTQGDSLNEFGLDRSSGSKKSLKAAAGDWKPGVDQSIIRSVMGRVGRASGPKETKQALIDGHKAELDKFFAKQHEACKTALGQKAANSVFKASDWNEQLATVLNSLGLAAAKVVGPKVAATLNHEWDPALGTNYIAKRSVGQAQAINNATEDDLVRELDSSSDEEGSLDNYFDTNAAQRSSSLSATEIGFLSAIIGIMVAKTADILYKTWVTGPNARPDHAAVDGETVPLDEPFSNGMMHPADYAAGAASAVNCNCSLEYSKEK